MKKRYIFDLDGTLIRGHYSSINEYFRHKYGEDAEPFLTHMSEILGRYEKRYSRYTTGGLSRILTEYTGLDMTPEVIQDWDALVGEMTNTVEPGAIETLEYLKSQGKQIVASTNWFGDSQRKRLKQCGLYPYFDVVYSGDIITKPHKEAYWTAAAGCLDKEVVFIGDNIDNDYIGPKACGLSAVLYDPKEIHHRSIVKIKELKQLKDYQL